MTLPRFASLLVGSVAFFFATFTLSASTVDELALKLNHFVDVRPEVERDIVDQWIMKTSDSCHAILRLKGDSTAGIDEEVILVDLFILDDQVSALGAVERVTAVVKQNPKGRIEDHSAEFETPCFESWYEGDRKAWGTRYSFTVGDIAVLVTPSVRSRELAGLLVNFLKTSSELALPETKS